MQRRTNCTKLGTDRKALATSGLTSVTYKGRAQKRLIKKKCRYSQSDIALLELHKPYANDQHKPVAVLSHSLKVKHGVIDYKKVMHSISNRKGWAFNNLRAKVSNPRTMKSLTPAGKAGSSGAVWVHYDSSFGDVAFAVTHGADADHR